jgi:hypothetical protein
MYNTVTSHATEINFLKKPLTKAQRHGGRRRIIKIRLNLCAFVRAVREYSYNYVKKRSAQLKIDFLIPVCRYFPALYLLN